MIGLVGLALSLYIIYILWQKYKKEEPLENYQLEELMRLNNIAEAKKAEANVALLGAKLIEADAEARKRRLTANSVKEQVEKAKVAAEAASEVVKNGTICRFKPCTHAKARKS